MVETLVRIKYCSKSAGQNYMKTPSQGGKTLAWVRATFDREVAINKAKLTQPSLEDAQKVHGDKAKYADKVDTIEDNNAFAYRDGEQPNKGENNMKRVKLEAKKGEKIGDSKLRGVLNICNLSSGKKLISGNIILEGERVDEYQVGDTIYETVRKISKKVPFNLFPGDDIEKNEEMHKELAKFKNKNVCVEFHQLHYGNPFPTEDQTAILEPHGVTVDSIKPSSKSTDETDFSLAVNWNLGYNQIS
jgi:hypothetical protein